MNDISVDAVYERLKYYGIETNGGFTLSTPPRNEEYQAAGLTSMTRKLTRVHHS